MAEVHPLREHRRKLFTDGGRSVLRATWHNEAGYVVLSLWRGDTCVATSHLTPREAGRLASFITSGLGDLADEAVVSGGDAVHFYARSTPWDRLRSGVESWRDSVGWSLEKIARRLRSGN